MTSSLISCALIQVCNIPLRAEALIWGFNTSWVFDLPWSMPWKLKSTPQTGGAVVWNSNHCHSVDPDLPADRVMLICQTRATFHNCYALHFADLPMSHEHALVPTTAETERPKPLITRNPLWIWFIIYNQWLQVQCRSYVMSQSMLNFGRWSCLKHTYELTQNLTVWGTFSRKQPTT